MAGYSVASPHTSGAEVCRHMRETVAVRRKWRLISPCTILTTISNELMSPLHDRIPVILDMQVEVLWLDSCASTDDLLSQFVAYPGERMEA
jgi:putative SOS response-associated peptidase YedK